MGNKYQSLLEPFQFPNGVEVKNRIVMAPMTNFSSNADGTVTEDEVRYYARRSAGVGMVVTACTYVTPNGKGFPGEFAADSDEMIPSLRQLASAIRAEGAKAVLQIFHGGRACAPGLIPNGETVSASDVAPEGDNKVKPRPLTTDETEDIIRAFGDTTRRAIQAGFDGIEIHGANGYLVQQFFSAHTNHRTDRFGGSLQNRLAFPLGIVDEVQQVVAQHATTPFIVGYRFSPEEPYDDGITMTDTFALVDALANKGLDYLHVSVSDFWSLPKRGADESASRVEWIQNRVGHLVPVIGVGSIHTPDEALKAFQTGVPLIALGREIIMEPDWVQKVCDGRTEDIRTTLTPDDQEELVVPSPLWQAIVNTPGWFPVVQKA